MEEQLATHDALHDTLTGLPNRRLFVDRLQHAIDHAKRNPEFKFAVLFVDILGTENLQRHHGIVGRRSTAHRN